MTEVPIFMQKTTTLCAVQQNVAISILWRYSSSEVPIWSLGLRLLKGQEDHILLDMLNQIKHSREEKNILFAEVLVAGREDNRPRM